MASEVATSLLGQHVVWYGDRGKEGGPVVAVTYEERRGEFVLLVMSDGKLRTKGSSVVSVE